MTHPNEKVVIIGAGCFGTSTAFHLLQRGFAHVTIIDRSAVLPAPDAASNDFNRIIRTSYDDIFYTKFAREAIRSWKNEKEWGDAYHESGVIVLGSPAASNDHATYVDKSFQNDLTVGATLHHLKDSDAIRAVFPSQISTGSFARRTGYLNLDGGWANASQGLKLMTSKVAGLGGKFVLGKTVTGLIRRNGRTTGVQCSDGIIFDAELVILATGSWTPSAFPELDIQNNCLATGQCVAMIQLAESEAEIYRQCPVLLDLSSGFYIFPPNVDNIVKMAIHAVGFTHTINRISTPRTVGSHSDDGLRIPRPALNELRIGLREIYPDLAGKPFSATRLCWYNDSPDGNWVIGRYPGDPSLMLATAGSGHAYKFLPVIGRLVADAVDGSLEPELVQKFALNREHTTTDASRVGRPVELELDNLCNPSDLLAVE
ncbi:FAD dependent oxidoreductase [Infundibulicybe gibba]|nr:FAD dependent oxidoreductase [Infundibulicybe gibba]